MRLSAEAYRTWKFKEQGLPHDLVARYPVQHTFLGARREALFPPLAQMIWPQHQWSCSARRGIGDTVGKRSGTSCTDSGLRLSVMLMANWLGRVQHVGASVHCEQVQYSVGECAGAWRDGSVTKARCTFCLTIIRTRRTGCSFGTPSETGTMTTWWVIDRTPLDHIAIAMHLTLRVSNPQVVVLCCHPSLLPGLALPKRDGDQTGLL